MSLKHLGWVVVVSGGACKTGGATQNGQVLSYLLSEVLTRQTRGPDVEADSKTPRITQGFHGGKVSGSCGLGFLVAATCQGGLSL